MRSGTLVGMAVLLASLTACGQPRATMPGAPDSGQQPATSVAEAKDCSNELQTVAERADREYSQVSGRAVDGFPTDRLPIYPGAEQILSSYDPRPSGLVLPPNTVLYQATFFLPETERAKVVTHYQSALEKLDPAAQFHQTESVWAGAACMVPLQAPPSGWEGRQLARWNVAVQPSRNEQFKQHLMVTLKVFLRLDPV